MPAKDRYHNSCKNALIKNRWSITHDPLRLRWGIKDMYIDLGAEKILTAEKDGQKIAVEIKTFTAASEINAIFSMIRGNFTMDTRETYRQLIQKLITAHSIILYPDEDVQFETIFDLIKDRYLLMIVGREKIEPHSQATKRVHGCLIHIDLIDDKIWIQRDGTETGIAGELVEAGVSKDKIVLAFYDPQIREETGFAVA